MLQYIKKNNFLEVQQFLPKIFDSNTNSHLRG